MAKAYGTTGFVVEGSYVEFQAAILRALPRDIDVDTRLGWTKNGESLSRVLRKALMPQVETAGKSSTYFLGLLSAGEELTLDATDGKEILADASDVFAYRDPNLRNWKADEQGQPTKEIKVSVYKLARDATHVQMFGSLNSDLEKLCLTQSQIKGFVKKHRKWLRADGYATLFPFKSYGQFFVARVDLFSGGRLHVYVHRFGFAHIWHADGRLRVVVSKLA